MRGQGRAMTRKHRHSGTEEPSALYSEEEVVWTFRVLDLDKSGRITPEVLREVGAPPRCAALGQDCGEQTCGAYTLLWRVEAAAECSDEA